MSSSISDDTGLLPADPRRWKSGHFFGNGRMFYSFLNDALKGFKREYEEANTVQDVLDFESPFGDVSPLAGIPEDQHERYVQDVLDDARRAKRKMTPVAVQAEAKRRYDRGRNARHEVNTQTQAILDRMNVNTPPEERERMIALMEKWRDSTREKYGMDEDADYEKSVRSKILEASDGGLLEDAETAEGFLRSIHEESGRELRVDS